MPPKLTHTIMGPFRSLLTAQIGRNSLSYGLSHLPPLDRLELGMVGIQPARDCAVPLR